MWGVIWYPLRTLEAQGLAGIWLTLLLFGAAAIASLPWTLRAAPQLLRRPGFAALLMLAAGWTNVAFIEAILLGNVLRVLLLFYLSPLWAVVLGWLVVGERPSRTGFLSLLVAMGGAMLMLWNPEIGAPWPQHAADWLALSSGFAFALSNVITRRVQDVPVAGKSLAVWWGVVLVAAVSVVVMALPVPAVAASAYAGTAALGIFGILVMTLLVQYGFTHLPVPRAAVLALVELIAGAISQQLLTDEVVSVREWIGGALILFGAWWSARSEAPPA